MSHVDDLLTKLCPKGVAYFKIGAVTQSRKGKWIKSTELTPGDIPVITSAREILYHTNISNSFSEMVVIASSGAYAGHVTYWNRPTYLSNVFAYSASEILLNKFLFYVLKHRQDDLHNLKSEGGVPNVYEKDVSNLLIPIPPLEIQHEIVKILDKFTELEAELESELEAEVEARKIQYEFFATKLFKDSCREGTCVLGDLAEIKYGYTDVARDEGELRFLRITDIDPNGKIRGSGEKFVNSSAVTADYLVKSGDLLMARTGATYGKTALIETDQNAVFASFLIRLRFNPEVMLPSFYWHFAQSQDYWKQANNLVSVGGQPQFNGNAVKQLVIPLPSIETQKSVVRILDSLNALMNDIKVSLPAEIVTRRKQYEYYRTKLLSFKDMAVA